MSTISNDTVPPWPSLYNPGVEILHIQYQPAVQPGGQYLYHADDVFRFTLYWTIIFYIPPFLICGFYAFWNYAFPPSPRTFGEPKTTTDDVHMSALNSVSPESKSNTHARLARTNERRTRVTFAIIVLLTFISLSLAGAVIGSAILGFAAFGLYKSANFNMSTWMPFLLAVMNVLIGLLSVWPSIIEII